MNSLGPLSPLHDSPLTSNTNTSLRTRAVLASNTIRKRALPLLCLCLAACGGGSTVSRKVGHDGGLLNIDAVVISPKFYDSVPAYGPDAMVERSKADAVAGRSADLVSDAPDCKADNDARRDSTRTDVAQSDLARGMDEVPTNAHQSEAPPTTFRPPISLHGSRVSPCRRPWGRHTMTATLCIFSQGRISAKSLAFAGRALT